MFKLNLIIMYTESSFIPMKDSDKTSSSKKQPTYMEMPRPQEEYQQHLEHSLDSTPGLMQSSKEETDTTSSRTQEWFSDVKI